MVREHRGEHGSHWNTIVSIAAKIGCSAQTLNEWAKRSQVDRGERPGVSTDLLVKLKAQDREIRELKQANEILRNASAYFPQAELDRPFKR
jgi:transposase-like protein